MVLCPSSCTTNTLWQTDDNSLDRSAPTHHNAEHKVGLADWHIVGQDQQLCELNSAGSDATLTTAHQQTGPELWSTDNNTPHDSNDYKHYQSLPCIIGMK